MLMLICSEISLSEEIIFIDYRDFNAQISNVQLKCADYENTVTIKLTYILSDGSKAFCNLLFFSYFKIF